MGERTVKQFILFCQRQGRDTHPDRSVGILNKERSEEATQHFVQDSPCRFLPTCGQLICFFLRSRTLIKMLAQPFSKMDPNAEAYGCMSRLIMGWEPLPSPPPRSLPVPVQTEKSALTSGTGTSLHFSRAQFLPLALSLEHGYEQSFKCTPVDNTVCPAQRPIYLLLHLYPTSPKLNKKKIIV